MCNLKNFTLSMHQKWKLTSAGWSIIPAVVAIFPMMYLSFIVPVNASKSALIGLKTRHSEYKIPKCVRKTLSDELEYYIPGEDTKMVYFCPKSDTSDVLYFSEVETCEIEPVPMIRRATDEESRGTECSKARDGYTLYTYGYKIAFSETIQESDEESWDNWIDIYTFCFNYRIGKILYFSYKFSSTNLLIDDLLEEERQYMENYRNDDFNNPILIPYMQQIYSHYADYDSTCTVCCRAMIIMLEDMAFAAWKKPLTHIINYAFFSHPLKAVQWAKISLFVRQLAIKEWGELHIKVGMLYPGSGNLYKIWWKLVITEDETHAVAIILHDIPPLMDSKVIKKFTCETSCVGLGFKEMIEPIIEPWLYCCSSDKIKTIVEDLKSYRLFDLTSDFILKPQKVNCD